MDVTRRGALAVGAGVFQQFPATARGGAADGSAAAWLRARAHPFSSADPGIDELAPLAAVLADGQVVGLGEASHGSHEDFAFKAALIRALVARGQTRVVALECNYRAGAAFDRYAGGQGGDPVELLRTTGFFQNWQGDEFCGLLTWIRAWNGAGQPAVRIVGVDCQDVGADAARALDWLRASHSTQVRAFASDLSPLIDDPKIRDGRTYELVRSLNEAQYNNALVALEALAVAIRAAPDAGGTEARIAAHSADAARQGLLAYEDETTFATVAKKHDLQIQDRRDRYMAENLLALSTGAKTAYWAHNLHVAPIEYGGAGNPTSTGGYLRRRIGRGFRALLFEYQRGHIHAKPTVGTALPSREAPWQAVERPPLPGGLAEVLASAGLPRYWLDLEGAEKDVARQPWLSMPLAHDWPGFVTLADWKPGRYDKIALLGAADVVVFQRDVTPSRLYPFVPQA